MTSTPLGLISLPVLALALQTIPLIGNTDITQIGSLSATAILGAGVIILWRKGNEKDAEARADRAKFEERLAAKDAVIMAHYDKMSESLANDKVVKEKMVETLKDIKDAVETISTVKAVLRKEN